MGVLVRLYEKLTGKRHQQQHADAIQEEAKNLSSHVQELRNQLRPYVESDDPLVSLMTDVFNQRMMSNRGDPQTHYPEVENDPVNNNDKRDIKRQ